MQLFTKLIYPTRLALIVLLSYSWLTPLVASESTATCQALFEYEAYNGPLPVVGGISFTNLSTGDYKSVSWDFGDNQFSSDDSEKVDHFYSENGQYTVCLNIWDDQDCSSQYCDNIQISITTLTCDQTDCVYPGDVNRDGKADLYDLVNLGLGYGATGPVRMNASTDWEPQMAEDWDQETPNGTNYKHLDCNGDGLIGVADLSTIIVNYSAMENPTTQEESDGPNVSLQFDADTIIIDQNTPKWIKITAGLMVGNSQYPFKDFYGMALYLDYDTTFVSSDESVIIDYNENSFIGGLEEVLAYGLDIREAGQVDLGFTRTDFQEVGGYGRTATVEFIIDADIIDGRTTNGDVVEFSVPINGVQVVDAEGTKKYVSLSVKPATVVFISGELSTDTEELELLSNEIEVYPNPANELLVVNTGEVKAERLELYNILGERLLVEATTNTLNHIHVNGLETGVYLLQVHTQEGQVLTKRVMIRR